MNTPNDNTAPSGLRGWWASPPRSGLHRMIAPYEYRHLRFFGVGRIIAGSAVSGCGFICLAYHAYPWAALFLVIGALNLAGGSWFVSIANSASPRT